MEIKKGFKGLLKENGFSDFDSFMGFTGGTVLKKISVRSITKFYLTKDGAERGFYLKRHCQVRRLKEKVKGLISPPAKTEARKEFDATAALSAAKVPCPTAVAYGERLSSAKVESFLITEALEGYVQLEAKVDDFAPPLSPAKIAKKRTLIKEVASLVALFHTAGFNHKDLYLTHILARCEKDAGDTLKLIDLQRVEHRRTGRRRWLVKDISALNYSSPEGAITRTDRLRFFKAYVGREKLTKEDRAFIKSVVAKTARIAAHTVKMYKRRAERVKKGLLER